MKFLLVGVNAKYSHTNLAIRLLRAYANHHSAAVRLGEASVSIGEYNINQNAETIVRAIYESASDVVLFSTYVWNRDLVFRVAENLRQVCPSVLMGLGGPEVSWSAENSLAECPSADFVVRGEGERTFCELVDRLAEGRDFNDVSGLYIRHGALSTGTRAVIEDLDSIPFPYFGVDGDFDPETRITYYESSRGCPFSCSYCLSSLDKTVRFYSLERVYKDLSFFLEKGFPLVKFVDRTFNLHPERYIAVWKYIRDHYNGKTLFHFEIAAEYLSDEALFFLETMPEGSIQFEIGVQSANPDTLRAVLRPAHPAILAEKIQRIPKHIHRHVDLIAGLPGEDLEKIGASFDFAFALHPDMLQLGFLKILSGTRMEEMAKADSGYIWSSFPPYEVMASPSLCYEDFLKVKDVEQVLDGWFNAGLMTETITNLVSEAFGGKAFLLFTKLAAHIRAYYPDGDLFLPRRASDSFACMASFLENHCAEKRMVFEHLRFDFLMQGKPGAFPDWFVRRYDKSLHDKALWDHGLIGSGIESRRNGYSRTEYDEFLTGEGTELQAVLFIYNAKKSSGKKVRTIKL